MPGLIDAVVSPTPPAGAQIAIERLSALLASAGIAMHVRRENLPGMGPAVRFEVRELGDLSHLHIQAIETLFSRANVLNGIEVVVDYGRKRFVLPHDSEKCMGWFRDDRGASSPRLSSAIHRVLAMFRAER
jgi:hypothetical protein